MRKYICTLLILVVFTMGTASISSYSRPDNVPSRPTEICAYIGIPMTEENDDADDDADDIEDDDPTEDDNSYPDPCRFIQFPEAVVDDVLGNIYSDETDIGFMTVKM